MVLLALLRGFRGGRFRDGFVSIHHLRFLQFNLHCLGGSRSSRFRANRLWRRGRSAFAAFAQFAFGGELAPVGHCELWFFFTHGVFPSFCRVRFIWLVATVAGRSWGARPAQWPPLLRRRSPDFVPILPLAQTQVPELAVSRRSTATQYL